jgi:hypothetical protein
MAIGGTGDGVRSEIVHLFSSPPVIPMAANRPSGSVVRTGRATRGPSNPSVPAGAPVLTVNAGSHHGCPEQDRARGRTIDERLLPEARPAAAAEHPQHVVESRHVHALVVHDDTATELAADPHVVLDPARQGVEHIEGLVLGADVNAIPDNERLAGRRVKIPGPPLGTIFQVERDQAAVNHRDHQQVAVQRRLKLDWSERFPPQDFTITSADGDEIASGGQ